MVYFHNIDLDRVSHTTSCRPKEKKKFWYALKFQVLDMVKWKKKKILRFLTPVTNTWKFPFFIFITQSIKCSENMNSYYYESEYLSTHLFVALQISGENGLTFKQVWHSPIEKITNIKIYAFIFYTQSIHLFESFSISHPLLWVL